MIPLRAQTLSFKNRRSRILLLLATSVFATYIFGSLGNTIDALFGNKERLFVSWGDNGWGTKTTLHWTIVVDEFGMQPNFPDQMSKEKIELLYREKVEDRTTSWMRNIFVTPTSNKRRTFLVYSGWPFHSMQGQVAELTPALTLPKKYIEPSVSMFARSCKAGRMEYVFFPLLPIWYGFLANSFLLFVLLMSIKYSCERLGRRRRPSKEHCRRCGYSLRGLPARKICPECGCASKASNLDSVSASGVMTADLST